MNIQPDDDVTTFDGREGVVIGIDGESITLLPHWSGNLFQVKRSDIATINQQETRPRAGAFPPPAGW